MDKSLKDVCIEVFKEQELIWEERRRKETDKFAKRALNHLNEILNYSGRVGNINYIPTMKILEKNYNCCTIQIEDLKFIVRTVESDTKSYPHTWLLQKCNKCDIEYETEEVYNMGDIGRILCSNSVKYHDCF